MTHHTQLPTPLQAYTQNNSHKSFNECSSVSDTLFFNQHFCNCQKQQQKYHSKHVSQPDTFANSKRFKLPCNDKVCPGVNFWVTD